MGSGLATKIIVVGGLFGWAIMFLRRFVMKWVISKHDLGYITCGDFYHLLHQHIYVFQRETTHPHIESG